MVREKDLPASLLAKLVNELIETAKSYHASVCVNGNARVAAECGADGVHLPQGYSVAEARRAVGRAVVGVSAHSLGEASLAEEEGADYVTLSPIFPTISKTLEGPPLGLRELRRVCGISIPVVALGGITPANAGECLGAGAAGIAVVGSVMGAARPRAEVEKYVRLLGVSRNGTKSADDGRNA